MSNSAVQRAIYERMASRPHALMAMRPDVIIGDEFISGEEQERRSRLRREGPAAPPMDRVSRGQFIPGAAAVQGPLADVLIPGEGVIRGSEALRRRRRAARAGAAVDRKTGPKLKPISKKAAGELLLSLGYDAARLLGGKFPDDARAMLRAQGFVIKKSTAKSSAKKTAKRSSSRKTSKRAAKKAAKKAAAKKTGTVKAGTAKAKARGKKAAATRKRNKAKRSAAAKKAARTRKAGTAKKGTTKKGTAKKGTVKAGTAKAKARGKKAAATRKKNKAAKTRKAGTAKTAPKAARKSAKKSARKAARKSAKPVKPAKGGTGKGGKKPPSAKQLAARAKFAAAAKARAKAAKKKK